MKESLLDVLDKNKIPKHVAIIMDGNGRWAKQRGMMRTFGHKNAIKAVKSAIEGARDAGVEYLTLYAFSTENWNRPESEVNTLMTLLASSLKKELKELMEKGIRVRTIGDLNRFPKKLQEELKYVIELSKNNTKGNLIVALSYGSRMELIEATKTISSKVLNNEISLDDITEELISQNLYTHDIPDVDLLIRTSGEYRISNFLLWQIAYAELYFTDILWPDFSKEEFFKAVYSYQNRERRFGKTSEQL
jgi:undecaprenyl diphosphate synthase